MKFFCAVVLACLLQVSVAQDFSYGKCPTNVKVDPRFNNAAAAGTWYIQEEYPFVGTVGVKCANALYGYKSETNITVTLRGVRKLTGGSVNVSYPAKLEGEGVISIVLAGVTVEGRAIYFDKEVLVIYGCKNILNQSAQYAWIFTKEQKASKSAIEIGRAAFTKAGHDVSKMVTMDQENCPAY